MNQPNHFPTYEAACADRGYEPADMLPKFPKKMPEWLQQHLTAEAKLVIIAEAIRQGRVPKPGERMYFPVFYKDASNNYAGFGLTCALYVDWSADTYVGERHEFFTREDAAFFANQFIDLHKATKIITIKIEENV